MTTVTVRGFAGGLGLVVPNLDRDGAALIVARAVARGRSVEVRYDDEAGEA